MQPIVPPGTIILLNGAPRSGKSSIAKVIQDTYEGVWMNLGVDNYMKATPERYQPGIGLRPGGERPDMEEMIVTMYEALYLSMAAHSRMGLNIVADVDHHDMYAKPRNILARCASIVADLPVLLVGVRCPLDVVMARRIETWGQALGGDGRVPAPVERWQRAVHEGHVYDLEVDTSALTPEQSAARIRARLADGPSGTAMADLARLWNWGQPV